MTTSETKAENDGHQDPQDGGGGSNVNDSNTYNNDKSNKEHYRNYKNNPDHGSSFMPGAGSEEFAPKSLDHFKRGYAERAAMREKEYYNSDDEKPKSNNSGQDHAEMQQSRRGGGGASVPTYAGGSMRGGDGGPRSSYAGGRGDGGRGGGRRPPYAGDHHHSNNNRGRADGRGGFQHDNYRGGRGDFQHDNDRGGTGRGNFHHRESSHPRRISDNHWGHRRNERPSIVQGLDVMQLVDRLAACSASSEFNATLQESRKEYSGAFLSGKACTAIISLGSRQRLIKLCYAVWDWMDTQDDLEKNIFHYNAMISVTEKAKDFRAALDFLREMKDKKVPKNEVTFSSAISACEKCGEWRVAVDLLDSMEPEGVKRTSIVYNAAISACEKGMVPQKACEIFQRMKGEGIRPSAVSYSALISAAEKGGQWKLALEILEDMKRDGHRCNVVATSAAISALAKGQQWEKALELFRDIQHSGGQPSIVTYNATMTALEKGMQWERALGLFDEMKSKNLPITVVSYGSALSACDKGLQYRQCLEFLDEMTEMGINKNVIIFGAALSCMEKCHRADISFQLMDRMRIDGIQPNVHIYNSAISACARTNLWEKGYELFQEMDKVGVRKDVVTYNAVLDAVASQIGLGRKLFEEGVEKGFYARVSRLGEQWFELDLHFLSLGGGEIALGWWFEECLVNYLCNTSRLASVKSISIVTGYGKTRLRGRRQGDDGMRKRCRAMLDFMNIRELKQQNTGRIHIDKEALIEEVGRNGGKVIFDLEGYIRWKESESMDSVRPDVPQKIRPRYKPANAGSGKPPFIRFETESTSAEYRLENQSESRRDVESRQYASGATRGSFASRGSDRARGKFDEGSNDRRLSNHRSDMNNEEYRDRRGHYDDRVGGLPPKSGMPENRGYLVGNQRGYRVEDSRSSLKSQDSSLPSRHRSSEYNDGEGSRRASEMGSRNGGRSDVPNRNSWKNSSHDSTKRRRSESGHDFARQQPNRGYALQEPDRTRRRRF